VDRLHGPPAATDAGPLPRLRAPVDATAASAGRPALSRSYDLLVERIPGSPRRTKKAIRPDLDGNEILAILSSARNAGDSASVRLQQGA
jgi:hypothetical protein